MPKVLHASKSGYFPACLIESSYLAKYSIVDAMAIYWRVRSWTITISGELPLSNTFTQTALDETYLVCDTTVGNQGAFVPLDLNNEFYLTGFYVNSFSSPTLYGVIPSFYMESGSVAYGSDEDEFSLLVGSYTLFGQSYPLYTFNDEVEAPPASGVIEPASYWSYGETWNTSTGERL